MTTDSATSNGTAVKAIARKESDNTAPGEVKAKNVQYFKFPYGTAIDKKTDVKVDLFKDKKLKIRQTGEFTTTDFIDIEIWKVAGLTDPYTKQAGKKWVFDEFRVFTLSGKFTAGNFVVETFTKGDANDFPEHKTRIGNRLYRTAGVEILNRKGVPVKSRLGVKMSFVLPEMEYDNVLELEMRVKVGGKFQGNPEGINTTWDSDNKGFAAAFKHGFDKNTEGIYHSPGVVFSGKLDLVVIHCMSYVRDAETLEDIYDYGKVRSIFEGGDKISAHFIIDRYGKVHQLVEIYHKAAHCKGSKSWVPDSGIKIPLLGKEHNLKSIGIELIGLTNKFRNSNKFAKAIKQKDKKKEYKALVEKSLKLHKQSLLRHKEKLNSGLIPKNTQFRVKVGNTLRDGHDSIKLCEKDIEKSNRELKQIEANEKWFENNKGYTDEQYESLKTLLYELGRHFGYNKLASHHRLSPKYIKTLEDGTKADGRKSDPGMYFDWEKIGEALLPGTLESNEKDGAGDESAKWFRAVGAKGGIFTVNKRVK